MADADDGLAREYYAILDIVGKFDERVLTVKGWGVTLSLAALAWGFQDQRYGLFLVAALSGLAFWLIEGVFKRHQMRYYLRMREIEVLEHERARDLGVGNRSTPRIDWSWNEAEDVYTGENPGERVLLLERLPSSYWAAWLLPHVVLPHGISLIAGLALLYAARTGAFGFDSGWRW